MLAAIRPAHALVASVLVLGAAADAQTIPAKDDWGAFRDFLQDRGVMIGVEGAARDGEALVLQHVRFWPASDPGAFVVDMPSLRVASRDGRLSLTPAPEFSATARAGRDMRVFTIRHDGEILTDLSEDAVSLAMTFANLGLALTAATRGNDPLPEQFSMDFGTLSLSVDATREGQADVALGAARWSYAFDLGPEAAENPFGQRSDMVQSDLRLTFSATELDLLELLAAAEEPAEALFAGGFSARLEMGVGEGEGTATTVIEGMPLTLTTRTTGGELSVAFADGRFDLAAESGSLSYDVAGGPVTGNVSAASMSVGLGMPLTVQPQGSPAYYRLGFEDVVISSPALALAGLQDFDGEVLDLALDVSADARLVVPLSKTAMEADVPPFDITTVTLARLAVGVGAASLTGSGAFTFDGPLAQAIEQDLPDGTGEFLFELIGGNALLQRLTAAGLIPPDQIFVVQMMMNGLGRSVGEDHLRSEVLIRPDGVVTVNGAPLPF